MAAKRFCYINSFLCSYDVETCSILFIKKETCSTTNPKLIYMENSLSFIFFPLFKHMKKKGKRKSKRK